MTAVMPRSVAALGALCLGAACSGPPAVRPSEETGVEVTVHRVFYDVEGQTPWQIRRAILETAPVLDDRRVYGNTQWQLRWEYRLGPTLEGCRIWRASVHLDFTITLPRWRRSPGTPRELEEAWRHFLRALAAHEDDHRHLTERGARDLVETLESLTAPHCAEVRRRAALAAREATRRIRDANIHYDRITADGWHRGVRWPPPSYLWPEPGRERHLTE